MSHDDLQTTHSMVQAACDTYRNTNGTGYEKMEAALVAAGFAPLQKESPLDNKLVQMADHALAAFLSSNTRTPADPRTVGAYVGQCAIEVMSHLKVVAPETLA